MRIAAIGPQTWFSNHFPEGWETDPDVLALDLREGDPSWLMILRNWRPDVTLFYRPELLPARWVRHMPGRRVAFLSEPLPALRGGRMEETAESALRLAVYRPMAWDAFHHAVFYDAGRRATVAHLGWPVSSFRPLPIDTHHFHPGAPDAERPVDVCFVGKATPHRIARLDALRSCGLRFLWVAHGVSGPALAALFRRCKVVLNLHADGVPALEPRIYLAAACGARVVSEPLSAPPAALAGRIMEWAGPLDAALLRWQIAVMRPWSAQDEAGRLALGVRRMLAEETGLAIPQGPGGRADDPARLAQLLA